MGEANVSVLYLDENTEKAKKVEEIFDIVCLNTKNILGYADLPESEKKEKFYEYLHKAFPDVKEKSSGFMFFDDCIFHLESMGESKSKKYNKYIHYITPELLLGMELKVLFKSIGIDFKVSGNYV